MIIQQFLFYLFSIILVFSSLMVISLRNPVHSVLFLILCFFNAASLFVLLKAEFIAMLLVIVYVGAVAVLFLFVVMMLNINLAEMKRSFVKYLFFGILFALVLFGELSAVLYFSYDKEVVGFISGINLDSDSNNAKLIGSLLYTHYFYSFQQAGLILLVAMIGAIILTLRPTKNSLKQDAYEQISRRREDSIEVIDIKFGENINKVYFNDRKRK